jgi:hypothetical protein
MPSYGPDLGKQGVSSGLRTSWCVLGCGWHSVSSNVISGIVDSGDDRGGGISYTICP